MKKILVGLLILGLIVVFGTNNLKLKGLEGKNSSLSRDEDEICNELSEILKDWFIKLRSPNFHDIKIKLELETLSTTQIPTVEAVFLLHATMVSDMRNMRDDPFLKGMRRFLEENRKNLSDSEINVIEKEINDYCSGIMYQMNKLNEENGFYKIVGEIGSSGKINKNNIKIYYDISGKGNHVWKSAENLSSFCKSYDKLEREGYEKIENLIFRLFPENGSEDKISSKDHYNNYYNRYWAVTYVDYYTTEATWNQYIYCRRGDGVIEISRYTNISKWNNSQFMLPKWPDGVYKQLACYNCADYVSQSMYNGGMWTDDYWNPSTRLTGAPDGKWYWTYIPHLKWWFWAVRGDWYGATYDNTQWGDVIIWPNDSHIAMIDYSNNSVKKFAAHTNDRKQHPYYSSDPHLYFIVSCWRWEPP